MACLERQLQLRYFLITDIVGKSSAPGKSDPFVSHFSLSKPECFTFFFFFFTPALLVAGTQ